MNYTLNQLQIFLEVVRQKSITRAAEEMHMTQPALSIQLKNFQNQFNIPLVEIIGKKLYVTDFGKSIASIAQNIINEANTIKYKTKEYSGLMTGKLRISSASTGKYVIPYFLSKFLREHPGIDLTLDVSNKMTVLKNLLDNQIDFALVSKLPSKLAIEEEILVENKLYLIGNSKKIDNDKPLIYREEGSATRMAMNEYFKIGKERKSMELTSNEAVKQALIAGLGYSILPLIGIKNELSNGELHIINLKKLPIITNWRLIWLKKKKLSPVAEAYLNFVRQEKEAIIKNNFGWYLNFDENKY
ncbi:DNA-binding transcriptional regulator, LysR family [Tenacibaculum sp. MAR_2009_124]|uniref:LysR family transcriptional regulator n=1 Tax=Tenacibaculum sp. MAR_2009_124 TaxID=1250059 RepID=UPI00089D04D6|nr:LysR family transcriptional regulator [Tenacibaculum sp. MAR_2009_124]SEB52211.1 DNA-binding transcriptional regulator, LysR family [Tenacibaculum sp. MAR_2009_124]